MAYWLIKSDPETYGWEEMKRDESTHWNGVRNFQARNNMAAMKKGDKCFFYHSGEDKAIVGIVEVIKEAYKDPEDKEGKFLMVDVKVAQPLKNKVTLAMIKQHKALKDFALVKQSRLSVMPVANEEWKIIQQMA